MLKRLFFGSLACLLLLSVILVLGQSIERVVHRPIPSSGWVEIQHPHRFETNKRITGHLDGIPISIPSNYLDGPIRYSDRSEFIGTLKNPLPSIDNFAIALRLPTLEPMHNDQDFRDYNTFFNQLHPRDPHNKWITLEIIADHVAPGASQSLQRKITNTLDGTAWGTFHQEPFLYYDLTHAKVDQLPKKSISSFEVAEIFYDAKTSNTVITCSSGPYKCLHTLILPELNAYATVYILREDIPDWRELEQRLHIVMGLFLRNY